MKFLILVTLCFFYINDAFATTYRALLVGVVEYPTLEEHLQLNGIKNDVALIRKLLLNNGFNEKNISVLAGNREDRKYAPTKANILREFERLVNTVNKDDFIFLYFSGHGAQQPMENGNEEVDGLDELFLPMDIGKWENEIQKVENAIVDDEINQIVKKLEDKGSFVWLVFDSCHSGTMLRGGNTVFEDLKLRKVDPVVSLNVPQSLMLAKTSVKKIDEKSSFELTRTVTFSAAHSNEATPEMRLPAGDPKRVTHGLFTFNLVKVLSQYPNATYRQLASQIYNEYRIAGWERSSPLIGGEWLDSRVFSNDDPKISKQWKLDKSQNDQLTFQAGKMHNIGVGAILAIYPTPVAIKEQIIGYVKVVQNDLFNSKVEPVAFNGKKEIIDFSTIPESSFARLVVSPIKFNLRIGKPKLSAECLLNKAMCKYNDINTILKNIETKYSSLELEVTDNESVDIQIMIDKSNMWLVSPSTDWNSNDFFDSDRRYLSQAIKIGLDRSNDNLTELLRDYLLKISKVKNLLRLTQVMGMASDDEIVDSTLKVKFKNQNLQIKVEPWESPVLNNGDRIELTIKNKMDQHVDLTILFVDSQYGIKTLFPRPGQIGRVEPKGMKKIKGKVANKITSGKEQFLIIAVPTNRHAHPMTFEFLEQKSLPKFKGQLGQSYLTNLIKSTMDNSVVKTRGFEEDLGNDTNAVIHVFNWNTVAQTK